MASSKILLGGEICRNCGKPKDSFKRSVAFASRDSKGGEHKEPAVALFDTGTECDNLISREFAEQFNLGTVEWRDDKKEKRSIWGKCKRAFAKLFRRNTPEEPHQKAEDGSTILYRTVDGRPIDIVGVLSDTRWTGANFEKEAVCRSHINFPNKFINDSEFLVVENLAFQVIFGIKTIHKLELLGSCSAGFVAKKSRPEGIDKYKKKEDDKRGQAKIQKAQEAAKKAGAGSAPKTNTSNKPK